MFSHNEYLLGQHLSHQLICFLSLQLELLCPLSYEILQVRGVLLQHPQHRVYNISLLSFVLELS